MYKVKLKQKIIPISTNENKIKRINHNAFTMYCYCHTLNKSTSNYDNDNCIK